MVQDGFYQLFEETGEPICWLLSRAAQRAEEMETAQKNASQPECRMQEREE